jgi:hypothetical protein
MADDFVRTLLLAAISSAMLWMIRAMWTLRDEHRAIFHDLPRIPSPTLDLGPPITYCASCHRDHPIHLKCPDLSLEGWITAETDMTFGEWVATGGRAQKIEAPTGNTGTR